VAFQSLAFAVEEHEKAIKHLSDNRLQHGIPQEIPSGLQREAYVVVTPHNETSASPPSGSAAIHSDGSP
jgi:hypothetical protein